MEALGHDVWLIIARSVDPDHAWVAALIGRAMRTAVGVVGRCRTSPAGSLGSLERYELALASGCPWTPQWFRRKAVYSTIVRDLERMCRMTALAAASGDLRLLERLRSNGCVWDVRTALAAAGRGDLVMLEWAHQQRCPLNENVISKAASAGSVEVLAWVLAVGGRVTTHTMQSAARAGHVHVMEWLRASGCDWDEATCAQAAAGGHLAALQWARQHGCAWDAWTCIEAARNGHLRVLEWARSTDCPWDERVTRHAAEKQQRETLRWAVEHGCVYYHDALACRGMERWLVERGHFPALDNLWVCCWAASNGDLELLRWLRSLGYAWSDVVTRQAVRGGHLEMLKWARAEGCEWCAADFGFWTEAAAHPAVLRWLATESDFPPQQLSDSDLGLRPGGNSALDAETLQTLKNVGWWTQRMY